MAIEYGVNLANGEIIGIANTTLYTSPTSGNRVIVNQARLVNYSAGAVVVDIYILLSGDSVSNEFKAIISKSLAADETDLMAEIVGNSLPAGATIVGIADTAASVSFSATGMVVTS